MFHFKIYENKTLYGLIYTFPNIGDGIPMHNHDETQKHNVIVLTGSVEVYGRDRTWVVELAAGEVFDMLDCHHPHEIRALMAGTRVLGLFTNGRPAGEYLPEDEKVGTIHKPMTYVSSESQ